MSDRGRNIFHIKEDQDPIGDGAVQKVYNDPTSKDRVIAIAESKREQSLNFTNARYYLGKILHLLLPDNCADVHLSSSKPNATIRQNLNLSPEYVALQDLLVRRNIKKEKIKSAEIITRLDQHAMNLPQDKVRILLDRLYALGVQIDTSHINFAMDNEGNVKYVEIPEPFTAHGRYYNPDEMKKAISKLEGENKERAEKYFNRLEALYRLYRDESVKARS